MKTISMTFGITLLLLAAISDAQAVVCAEGAWHAGCAGPHGAVVVPKAPVVVAPRAPVVVAPARPVVVAPGRNCAWVNGARVCR